MDTRDSLDDMEKRKLVPLPALELRSLGRPVRSQSLYRLRYPGSLTEISIQTISYIAHRPIREGGTAGPFGSDPTLNVCPKYSVI
jgi:hypothetical protein